ncbi:hypothetical protein [Agarivorans sp. Toyoura001]|uniref:hypothetical protein n=1 Tax=unclassified Agarivorans TaxID=2636026 RepID=UPI0010FA224B|nr:hypothetical protein [Agarivorans sp. Toyoura001]
MNNKNSLSILMIGLVVLLLSGCKSVGVGSGFEERLVSVIEMPTRSLSFTDAVVWLDNAQQGKRGVRFLQGEYALEAEDDDYWYFHAPSVIEMGVLEGGNVVAGKRMAGGLMLAKSPQATVAAGAYLDSEAERKIMVLKIGRDFLDLKGNKWLLSNSTE